MIDTNVVLDMLVFRDPRGLAVLGAVATGRYRWIACPAMRGELAYVLDREVCRRRGAEPGVVLAAYDGAVVGLAPPEPPTGALRCSDPDDQVFIDLAVRHGAHALLTRDRALLRLAARARGVGVVVATPEAWLARR